MIRSARMRTPLVFVSGDDKGCEEAKKLDEKIVTAVVKTSLDEAQAILKTPAATEKLLKAKATEAVRQAKYIQAAVTKMPVTIQIQFSKCKYLESMKQLHPEIFIDDCTVQVKGEDTLLKSWSDYLLKEKEMVEYE